MPLKFDNNGKPVCYKYGMSSFVKELTEEEKDQKKRYFEEQCEKYGTTDWATIQKLKEEEREKSKKEYEERCKKREEREEEKKRWWEANKERIERERERKHQEYLERKAERHAHSRAVSGKPIPGAWRTANRPDGW